MQYYVIASTQRSGSSLLCHMVRQTDVLGRPMEFFNEPRVRTLMAEWEVDSPNEFYRQLVRTRVTRNHVFGFKAHYHQFVWLNDFGNIDDWFPELKFVHIDRLDRLSQAISLARANQTREFSSTHSSQIEPRYSFEDIADAMRTIVDETASWDRIFTERGVSPLRVTYEDLLEDADATVRKIADYLKVPAEFEPVRLELAPIEKQRDELSEEWRERALVDLEEARGDRLIGPHWAS